MTVPAQNPFADPIQPPSVYPSQASLRGRLVLITPRKIETKPSNLNPGQTQEIITADVTVVDGLGPVPDIKNNQHSGQWLEGPDFTGVWLSGQRVVDQLRSQIGTGQSVLGVIETYQPGQVPMKGNPWGILTATPEQKAQASQFLATRTVAAAAAPAPYQQQAPAPYQQQAPAPYTYDTTNDIDKQLLATQQAQAPGQLAYTQQGPSAPPVPAQPQYQAAPAQPQYQQQQAAPAQPQYQQQAAPPAPAPAAQPVAAPVQTPAPGVATTPASGQAPAANPFLQNAPAPAQAQPVNPFLQQAQAPAQAQPVNPFLQNAPQQ